MLRAAVLSILLVSPALAAQTPQYTVRPTATPCLRLRPAPVTDSVQFDCLPPGTTVQGLRAVPFWQEVRLRDGRTGWAAKKFLAIAPAPAEERNTEIPADAWLEVHFVDVGTGDGIWIATHDDGIAGNGRFEGRNVVIDGGPRSADGTNAMLAYLRAHAHEGAIIDALVLTHAHKDHYRGAAGILRHFDVRSYYDPGYRSDDTGYSAFLNQVRREKADGKPIHAMMGQAQFRPFDLGREVQLEVLYSDPGQTPGLGSSSHRVNNSSIVLRMTYGKHVFLFMGDAEGREASDPSDRTRYVEKRLLETHPELLRANVLKVGHHGSATTNSSPFIAAVDPEIVIVQSGRKPYSGTYLPDGATLRRFCEHNPKIRIFRTDRDDEGQGRTGSNDADGDHVVLRTNGDSLEVIPLADGVRYTVSGCSAD